MTLLDTDDGKRPNATPREVEQAICQLDGVTWTLVRVEDPSGRTLTIGGGPRRFVAEVADDATHRFALIDPSRGGGRIDLVVGGQLVDYPARVCVTLEVVLAAARVFTERAGARDPALAWSVES
ncbi:MAG TPA: Imm1 family immunity protein [Gemmatimonadales bacterium]|nr:Imm1 family immunity protein [Gemmatimonadales bacterium]